jgi:hypothetical protein
MTECLQDARAQEDAEEAAQQSCLKAAVEDRREHIKQVVSVIKPDLSDPDDAYFIDTEWLTKWANAPPSEELPTLDNKNLMCEHGNLDPLAWDSAKRISGAAWRKLKEQWDGGPELTHNDLCLECTRTQLEEIVQKYAFPFSCSLSVPVSPHESGPRSACSACSDVLLV